LQPIIWLLASATFFSAAMAQTPVPISRSTTLEATLKSGISHEYTLRLARGESAEIVVHQQGVDVVVELKAPRESCWIQ